MEHKADGYKVNITVIEDGGGYYVYINNYFLDFWGDKSNLLYTNAEILKSIIGFSSFFSTEQLQFYLIRNFLYKPQSSTTKLTRKEIEKKLNIENLEIITEDE